MKGSNALSNSPKLRVLLVDDEPQRLRGLRSLFFEQVEFIIRDPFDVEAEDLLNIDLVSVDEFLGDEWLTATESGAQSSPASTRNRDGLAVAASFRSQTRTAITGDPERTAVTLHTGALERIAEGLPQERREALTAAQHDLEWVFSWEAEDFGPRLIALAQAAHGASLHASRETRDFGAGWLNLPGAEWSETARAQIEDCRPPAHALAQNTSGRSLVRWLAHRILPYPTFLLDRSHAANLLGVTQRSFDRFVSSDHAQQYEISYTGPLNDFLGRRWWRAGLQQMLVDVDRYQWDSSADRAQALADTAGVDLTPLTHDQPVVAYDSNGRVSSIDADAEQAVRLQADGWPVFADDPWALIHVASADSDLRSLVAQSERHRLEVES